jgi:hypothetical protein
MMGRKEMKESKWILWVGGTPNYFDTKEEAEFSAELWIKQGYDDIIIERA